MKYFLQASNSLVRIEFSFIYGGIHNDDDLCFRVFVKSWKKNWVQIGPLVITPLNNFLDTITKNR